MRIIVNGQQAFGRSVLETFLDRSAVATASSSSASVPVSRAERAVGEGVGCGDPGAKPGAWLVSKAPIGDSGPRTG